MSKYLNEIKAGNIVDTKIEEQLEHFWRNVLTDKKPKSNDLIQQQILSELKGIRQELKQLKWEGLLRDFHTFNKKLKMI